MARKTKVVVVCDRHRTDVEATGTVEFVLDGERRKLDLCAEHMAEVRKAIRPWLRQAASGAAPAPRAARKATAKGRKAAGNRPRRDPEAGAIRAWAAANGF